MKLSTGNGFMSIDMSTTAAVFETDFPYIVLPEIHARQPEEYIGMYNAGEDWDRNHIRSIDCNMRQLMENITLTLGEQDFVMTPWEYTMEVDVQVLGIHGTKCLSAFQPHHEYCWL
jgi:hypothetical protein